MTELIIEGKDGKKYTPNELVLAVETLQGDLKEMREDSHDRKELEIKLNAALDAQEEHNTDLVKQIETERKANEDLTETVKAVELEIARKVNTVGTGYKDTAEYKALQKWFQGGLKKMDADEVKALRTDDDTAGGYLTTTEFDTELLKNLTEISAMRSVARIKIIGEKSLTIAKRLTIPTVYHEGETEDTVVSQSSYASEQLIPFRLSCAIPYTHDELQTSVFNLENEIRGDANEAFGKQMGEDYVKGTGVKMSEGFTVNADVLTAKTTSEASGAISAKDLTLMTGELKAGYNPMYGFNRRSLALFRTLEDGAGRPIWQMNLGGSAPNQINGEPYIILPDMADIAGNSLSVVYADFMRGYRIVDRAGLVIIRDEVTLAGQAMIKMYFHRWTYGQVVLAEAIHIMATKA